MKIKVKKLHPEAKVPVKAHPSDTGWDVYCVSDPEFDMGSGCFVYSLGIALEPPKGYAFAFRPRSSIYKTGLIQANSVGTVDESYRGELKAIYYKSNGVTPNIYRKGDRIGQLVLEKVIQCDMVEVEELGDTTRGGSGFGSTGNK